MPECTCFPSPPGGITRCESSQTAICGYDELGRCEGRCVTIASGLAPLDYTAQLLSEIVGESLSADDLEGDARNCAVIANLLLDSSEENKAVKFKLNGRPHRVSVGLTEVAKKKLRAAARTLEGRREPPAGSAPTRSRPERPMLSSEA
jgi:hypothetical protein